MIKIVAIILVGILLYACKPDVVDVTRVDVHVVSPTILSAL
jgi:hypothetical protein